VPAGYKDSRYAAFNGSRLRNTPKCRARIDELNRFHSCLNRFEPLESLEFSVFFCGALDRNMIRFGYLIREDGWSSARRSKSGD
jgi:hypothetical protein